MGGSNIDYKHLRNVFARSEIAWPLSLLIFSASVVASLSVVDDEARGYVLVFVTHPVMLIPIVALLSVHAIKFVRAKSLRAKPKSNQRPIPKQAAPQTNGCVVHIRLLSVDPQTGRLNVRTLAHKQSCDVFLGDQQAEQLLISRAEAAHTNSILAFDEDCGFVFDYAREILSGCMCPQGYVASDMGLPVRKEDYYFGFAMQKDKRRGEDRLCLVVASERTIHSAVGSVVLEKMRSVLQSGKAKNECLATVAVEFPVYVEETSSSKNKRHSDSSASSGSPFSASKLRKTNPVARNALRLKLPNRNHSSHHSEGEEEEGEDESHSNRGSDLEMEDVDSDDVGITTDEEDEIDRKISANQENSASQSSGNGGIRNMSIGRKHKAAKTAAGGGRVTAIKIAIVGDRNVGKTSLIRRYVEGVFDAANPPTSSPSFLTKTIKIKQTHIVFNIFDIQKEESLPSACNGAMVIFFLFSLTDASSLTSLSTWHKRVTSAARHPFHAILVGTKYDLFADSKSNERTRVVDEARECANTMKAALVFTSSADGTNVVNLFKITLSRALNIACKLPRLSNVNQPIVEH